MCRWQRGGRLSSRLMHELQRRTALVRGQAACCAGIQRAARCPPHASGFCRCFLARLGAWGCDAGQISLRCCAKTLRPQPAPLLAASSAGLLRLRPGRGAALPPAGRAAAARAGGARPAAVQPLPRGALPLPCRAQCDPLARSVRWPPARATWLLAGWAGAALL